MSDQWESQDSGAKHEQNDSSSINDEANGTTEATQAQEAIDPKAGNEKFEEAARERGWTEPIAINYQELEAPPSHEQTQWGAMQARYEWSDEYGDVAPPVQVLEAVLYGGEHRMRQGAQIDAFAQFECEVQGPERLSPIRDFADAGLHPVMLENLKLCGYSQPTPIQSYCVPYGLKGNDLVAIAQTGSGKTAAYMIPVLSKLMGKAKRLAAAKPDRTVDGYDPKAHKVRAEPLVVIVVPARELAIQIFDEARRLCYRSMLRPCVTYGGLPYSQTLEDLGQGCDILIATPGRLVDLMDKPSVLSFKRVKYTILDEADTMLEDDWAEELEKIMSGGDMNKDADHIFMLFSATFPRRAMDLAKEYLAEDYFKITVGRVGSTHRNIEQIVMWCEGDRKQECLWDLLMTSKPERTLIFCNSKRSVDTVDDFLYNRGLPTTSIHSGREQREREDSLRSFKTGKCPILIATGVSARGWDIYGIAHVINYDLPDVQYGGIHEYVHRIGRTARIGHTGTATSFYNDRNEDIGKALANTLLDSKSEVPEFLQHFLSEDGKAHFEDDDELENDGFETAADSQGDTWGGADNTEAAEEPIENGHDSTELSERLEGIAV